MLFCLSKCDNKKIHRASFVAKNYNNVFTDDWVGELNNRMFLGLVASPMRKL